MSQCERNHNCRCDGSCRQEPLQAHCHGFESMSPEGQQAMGAMCRAAAAQLSPADPRRCRVCGCTDADCSGCIQRTGQPCRWSGPDICSACTDDGPQPSPVWVRCGTCGLTQPTSIRLPALLRDAAAQLGALTCIQCGAGSRQLFLAAHPATAHDGG